MKYKVYMIKRASTLQELIQHSRAKDGRSRLTENHYTTGSSEYLINRNQFVSPVQLVTSLVHTKSPTSKGYKDRHLFCDCTRESCTWF